MNGLSHLNQHPAALTQPVVSNVIKSENTFGQITNPPNPFNHSVWYNDGKMDLAQHSSTRSAQGQEISLPTYGHHNNGKTYIIIYYSRKYF